MNNLNIGDLVVVRKKGGLVDPKNLAAVERRLEAGEEHNLGLIIKKYKENSTQ